MELQGKDLKSACNSCGASTTHDANHKAGKALVNFLKQGGGTKVDITKKDRTQEAAAEGSDDEPAGISVEQIKADLSDEDDEATYESKRVEKIIGQLQKLSADDMEDNGKVHSALSTAKSEYGMSGEMHADFDHYLALCGLFPPKRNIIKHWATNEDVFLSFVRKQGNVGIEHFMQALVLYFIRSK